jgi:hypothetical protein
MLMRCYCTCNNGCFSLAQAAASRGSLARAGVSVQNQSAQSIAPLQYSYLVNTFAISPRARVPRTDKASLPGLA